MKQRTETTTVTPTPPIRLYTTSEAAALWGISRWTIYDLVKTGRLKPIIGIGPKWRWKEDDLEKAGVFQRL